MCKFTTNGVCVICGIQRGTLGACSGLRDSYRRDAIGRFTTMVDNSKFYTVRSTRGIVGKKPTLILIDDPIDDDLTDEENTNKKQPSNKS